MNDWQNQGQQDSWGNPQGWQGNDNTMGQQNQWGQQQSGQQNQWGGQQHMGQGGNGGSFGTPPRRNRRGAIIAGVLVACIVVGIVLWITLSGGAYSPSGSAPQQSQLYGRWELTRTVHRGASSGTFTPGHPNWSGSYHITFEENGEFTELNFWNFTLAGFLHEIGGTWSIDGRALVLQRTQGQVGIYSFISERRLGISSDGNTLSMTYSRRHLQNGRNVTWHYRHTFVRV